MLGPTVEKFKNKHFLKWSSQKISPNIMSPLLKNLPTCGPGLVFNDSEKKYSSYV